MINGFTDILTSKLKESIQQNPLTITKQRYDRSLQETETVKKRDLNTILIGTGITLSIIIIAYKISKRKNRGRKK